MDVNRFVLQKSISQHFLNVAVLQSQIAVLVQTCKKEEYDGIDKAIISLILLNIFFQSVLFSFITVIDYIQLIHHRSKLLNVFSVLISGLIVMLNITITVLVENE
jgi:hypothetical protein